MFSNSLASLNVRQQNVNQAIGFMLISVALYASQDVLIKSLPVNLSLIQIVFFRSIFAFIPILIFALRDNDFTFVSQKWGMHLLRSLFSSLALICFIASFRMIPLADAYSLTFSCPLFMTALCVAFLKEKVPLQRWFAVSLGFVGVLIIMRPGTTAFQIGGMVALLGGFFNAVSLIYVRALSGTESNTLIVSTFTLMSVLLSGILVPFYWQPMDTVVLLPLVVIGILGGTAQYAMTQAFRQAPVSVVAPFDYAALLWALGFGYLFWGDLPNWYMATGCVIVIGSGMYLIQHEKNTSLN